jgi:hypothetical protein
MAPVHQPNNFSPKAIPYGCACDYGENGNEEETYKDTELQRGMEATEWDGKIEKQMQRDTAREM